ncbi:hypothetical protein ACIQUB_24865 [Rhizobium sp. NPDC090275]|uniref:hypothetical protein n=1 Tax=Rhizobium sp. NPDC090275 TaxID=3364498 RepID=UPI00383BA458
MIGDDDQRKLSALLDVLLPGTDGFPSGSAAGVGPRLSSAGVDAELICEVLGEIATAFADWPISERTSAIVALETQRADLFQVFLAAAYRAYYTAPAVLAVISATTGYHHPPQPVGYALPAFDETILEKVKRNPPSWRDAPSPNIEGSKQ